MVVCGIGMIESSFNLQLLVSSNLLYFLIYSIFIRNHVVYINMKFFFRPCPYLQSPCPYYQSLSFLKSFHHSLPIYSAVPATCDSYSFRKKFLYWAETKELSCQKLEYCFYFFKYSIDEAKHWQNSWTWPFWNE